MGKSILLFIILSLLISGCSREKIDLTYILESDEIIIEASTFRDGKKFSDIGKKGIISNKKDIETFYNFVSEINFVKISSKKAAEIYRKNEQSNSLLVIPTITDNSKEEIYPMFNVHEDGTMIWIEFEKGIGNHLYKAKDKSLYKEVYSYYEKNLVDTLQIK